jgi:putative GTP pyrophosphokinase
VIIEKIDKMKIVDKTDIILNDPKESFISWLSDSSKEEIIEIAEAISKLMTYYRCAMLEIETKFKVLNEQFSLNRERNPIESIKTRLKSPQSIQDKLKRLEVPMTLSSIENYLNDVAGIRVICGFVDDIYLLADCLERQDDVKILKKKDYIKNPKPNGYRSLHLIVEIPIFLCEEKKYIKAEIQLRTIAMESWANLEHRLRYKKNLNDEINEKTKDALLECAELSSDLDRKMQSIRNIIEK